MDVPPNTLALRALGVTWVIGPRRLFNRLPETIMVRTSGHAMSVLRRFSDDDSEIWRLRKLLDEDPACGISSHRISKQSLLDQIANLVERGLLCFVEVRPIAPASVAALHAALQGISPASEQAKAATRKAAAGAMASAPVTARSVLASKASTPAGTRPPVPASTGTRSSAAVEHAFSQWSIEERFLEALARTGPKLPARFRAAFAELLTPEVAATLVGTLALIAAAHMIGGVFAAAIDVLLIGVGFAFLGWTAFEAGQQLGRFIYLSATATDVTALDEAAEALAKIIVLIGVEALLVLLTKAAVKARASHIRETGPAGGQPRPLNFQPNSRTAAPPARKSTKIGAFASLRRLTASEANSAHVNVGRRPPYAADGAVDEVRIMEDTVFARVHGADNKARSWMMASEDIRGLSAVEIKNRYALPDLPMFVSDVKVPAGTIVRSGEVAPQAGWGSGGATQFELMQRLPESAFINTRPL